MEPIAPFSIFNDLESTSQNVKDIFQVLLTDESAETLSKEAFTLRGALFATATQFLLAKLLVLNADDFSKKLQKRREMQCSKNLPP